MMRVFYFQNRMAIWLTGQPPGLRDEKGQLILATKGTLPEEIVAFLSQNGYEILGLHY